jgi:dihydroorotase-like cyclic amidohydrolase
MKLVHSGEIEINLLISVLTAAPAKIIGNRYGKLGTLEKAHRQILPSSTRMRNGQ